MSDRADSTRPSRAFILSDRVEGTAIHDPAGKPLGTIKRLIIEKTSGRVAYVVISFGGTDEVPHAVPWGSSSTTLVFMRIAPTSRNANSKRRRPSLARRSMTGPTSIATPS